MQQQFDFPFATLATLKERLEYDSTDFDGPLAELLKHVTNVLERTVGRRLRRWHSRSERFTGGYRTIRVGIPPIAHIDYVRESYERDFEDPSKYDELVEGTDYVLDTSTDGGLPGETGVIRRLGRNWLGDRESPGQIEVRYTGGWKTEGEQAIEDGTLLVSSADRIMDYVIQRTGSTYYKVYSTGTEDPELPLAYNPTPGDPPERVLLYRFNVADVFVGSWGMQRLTLRFWGRWEDGEPHESDWATWAVSFREDPRLKSNAESLFSHWDFYGSTAAANHNWCLGTSGNMDEDWREADIDAHESDNWDHIQENIRATLEEGSYIALLVRLVNPFGNEVIKIASTSHGIADRRPSLEIVHNPSWSDPFDARGDLVHATILQATHEWNTRYNGGLTMAAQRGVSVASGASIGKPQIALLPEVQQILESYVQLY